MNQILTNNNNNMNIDQITTDDLKQIYQRCRINNFFNVADCIVINRDGKLIALSYASIFESHIIDETFDKAISIEHINADNDKYVQMRLAKRHDAYLKLKQEFEPNQPYSTQGSILKDFGIIGTIDCSMPTDTSNTNL